MAPEGEGGDKNRYISMDMNGEWEGREEREKKEGGIEKMKEAGRKGGAERYVNT